MQIFAWFVLLLAAVGVAVVWMMAADLKVRYQRITELLDQKERDLLIRYQEAEGMMADLLAPAPPPAAKVPFESFLEGVPRIQAKAAEAPGLPAADHRRSAVEDLLQKGFEPEHIARDMGMGKGEVRLIAQLMKKNAG